MSKRIGVVCGSFHKDEVERMLAYSTEEAQSLGLTVGDVVWVPGSMEVPSRSGPTLGNPRRCGLSRHH